MQSLLNWVAQHSEYAIFAVFIVSTMESLALVGIMIPGMLFMLGVGTLIGVGSLDFWPMFVAASLGAIAGDGLSFWLGRHFNENLRHVWPLPKFPGLLQKGENFFHRHGAMSVLFGRFVGPLRAIVPAVAGMLKMEPGRFLLFNIISALAWAPVVLLPGALLGASLAQVSAVAMRFGLLVFFVGLAFWCLGWLLNHTLRRWVLTRIERLRTREILRYALHALVYAVVLIFALFYRLHPPELPNASLLQRLAAAKPPLKARLGEEWQDLARQGFTLFYLGDPQRLASEFQAQGWRKGETWDMASALIWLGESEDLSQLVFSDPRLYIYKVSLKKTLWIRARNANQVWLLEMWAAPQLAANSPPEPIAMFGSLHAYTVHASILGYRYYTQDSLSDEDKRELSQLPFPSALLVNP